MISKHFDFDTFFQTKNKNRNGMPLNVPEELELLVDKAADRINLSVREATYLKTFMVSGFDIKSVGKNAYLPIKNVLKHFCI